MVESATDEGELDGAGASVSEVMIEGELKLEIRIPMGEGSFGILMGFDEVLELFQVFQRYLEDALPLTFGEEYQEIAPVGEASKIWIP